MDAVDATAHYEVVTSEEAPSLLTIILDTNPRAWAALSSTLPLSRAIANILVFANSHLAFSSGNRVAVIASHSHRAEWLYPSPSSSQPQRTRPSGGGAGGEDVDMTDAPAAAADGATTKTSANKFPQFAEVETSLLKATRELIASTAEADLGETTTLISGALTLALAHINKTSLAFPSTRSGSATDTKGTRSKGAEKAGLDARILIISVSDSSPAQYIPTMNAVFAASHSGIAIDVLSLRGTATFLQQASFITRGTFLSAEDPQGLLTYLMFGFGATSSSEDASSLISPSTDVVDFRAACFCHRKVVDTGFVCSICLSIFCEVPEGAECLTCGTKLALGSYGAKPAVVPRVRRKKKRRIGINGETREETGSAAGTPLPV